MMIIVIICCTLFLYHFCFYCFCPFFLYIFKSGQWYQHIIISCLIYLVFFTGTASVEMGDYSKVCVWCLYICRLCFVFQGVVSGGRGGGGLDVCVHLSMCEGFFNGGGGGVLDVCVHLSMCEGFVNVGGGGGVLDVCVHLSMCKGFIQAVIFWTSLALPPVTILGTAVHHHELGCHGQNLYLL